MYICIYIYIYIYIYREIGDCLIYRERKKGCPSENITITNSKSSENFVCQKIMVNIMSIRETDLVRKLKQTIPQSLYFILEFSENNNSKSKSVSLHLLKKYFLTNIKVA